MDACPFFGQSLSRAVEKPVPPNCYPFAATGGHRDHRDRRDPGPAQSVLAKALGVVVVVLCVPLIIQMKQI